MPTGRAVLAVVLACLVAVAVLPGMGGAVTVALDRSTAGWGETVRFSGDGAGSGAVRILVDGLEAGRAQPTATGAYSYDYLVDRLPEGVHVVGVETGGGMAEATLEVVMTDPVLRLGAVPTEHEGEPALRCTGNLTANGRGVPGASVRLVFDGETPADCITGPAGQFELLGVIAPGTHTVVANVSFDDGRPLRPATSAVVEATVPGGFPWLPALAVVAVLLLAGVGGFLYWRGYRHQERAEPAPLAPPPAAGSEVRGRPPEPMAPPVESAAPVPSPGSDLRATALRLAGDGGREGIEAVYRGLVRRLAEREPGGRLEGLTPRELAARFEGRPGGLAVGRVAACYEAVAYAGRPPTPVDIETVVEGYVAALTETARAGE